MQVPQGYAQGAISASAGHASAEGNAAGVEAAGSRPVNDPPSAGGSAASLHATPPAQPQAPQPQQPVHAQAVTRLAGGVGSASPLSETPPHQAGAAPPGRLQAPQAVHRTQQLHQQREQLMLLQRQQLEGGQEMPSQLPASARPPLPSLAPQAHEQLQAAIGNHEHQAQFVAALLQQQPQQGQGQGQGQMRQGAQQAAVAQDGLASGPALFDGAARTQHVACPPADAGGSWMQAQAGHESVDLTADDDADGAAAGSMAAGSGVALGVVGSKRRLPASLADAAPGMNGGREGGLCMRGVFGASASSWVG